MTEQSSDLDDVLLARLKEISRMAPTIDLTKRDTFVAAAGWHIDAREIDLPAETPGTPQEHGSVAIAREILRQY